MSDYIGQSVRCVVCRRTKAPRGRSISDASWDSYCTDDSRCAGYAAEPFPECCLWPGEKASEFGHCTKKNPPAPGEGRK